MKRTLLFALVASICSAQDGSFVVEKLTPAESKAYQKAVQNLADTEARIKAAHGEKLSGEGNGIMLAYCGPRYTRHVEIKGDYALVDITAWDPCSGASLTNLSAAAAVPIAHIQSSAGSDMNFASPGINWK